MKLVKFHLNGEAQEVPGDHLKDVFGSKIVAVEAAECPTLLCNGFGEHNIQGIGDKHIPFFHNVMNTDMVVGVSDHATDTLFVLFNSAEGRNYLVERRLLDASLVGQLRPVRPMQHSRGDQDREIFRS